MWKCAERVARPLYGSSAWAVQRDRMLLQNAAACGEIQRHWGWRSNTSGFWALSRTGSGRRPRDLPNGGREEYGWHLAAPSSARSALNASRSEGDLPLGHDGPRTALCRDSYLPLLCARGLSGRLWIRELEPQTALSLKSCDSRSRNSSMPSRESRCREADQDVQEDLGVDMAMNVRMTSPKATPDREREDGPAGMGGVIGHRAWEFIVWSQMGKNVTLLSTMQQHRGARV